MTLLAPLLVSLVPAAADGAAPAPLPEPRVLSLAGSDVLLRLPLDGWRDDPETLALLRKSGGEHVILAGWIGPDAVRATIQGGPVPTMDGDEVRRGTLGDRLLGMGLSTIAGFAAAETERHLNPPYREVDRHVFLIGAGALAHVQVIALEGDAPELFPRSAFERIATEARFAVARRTDWAALSPRYLEASHVAAIRADGVAWLHEAAEREGADALAKLVAAEHATAARSAEPWVADLYRAVLEAVPSLPEGERAWASFLCEDGLALALARAGSLDESAVHAQSALDLAAPFGSRGTSGARVTQALVAAARKDADQVVLHLEAAYAIDRSQRYRVQREPLLEGVRADPRVAKLLAIQLAPRMNRSLGGH